MKTRNYLLTLLALIIQVMVNGQTQENQASQNNSSKLAPVIKRHSSGIVKKQMMDGKPIITQEPVIKQEPSLTKDKVAVNTAPTSKSSAQTLKQQANDLTIQSKNLRQAAQSASGLTKNELISEANELYKQAEIMLITALELSGVKNKEAYNSNKSYLNQLLEQVNTSALVSKQANGLISEANMNMRLANEMREEANAMPTNAGKLGSLSNADEKETLAIGEQKEAINILRGYALRMSVGVDIDDYASK